MLSTLRVPPSQADHRRDEAHNVDTNRVPFVRVSCLSVIYLRDQYAIFILADLYAQIHQHRKTGEFAPAGGPIN